MKLILVAAFVCAACVFAASTPCFAETETWSGYLVDAKCYQIEEENVNPTDTMMNVDRDRDLEVRMCMPNAKTTTFAVVESSGLSFKLDPAGNAKAAALIPAPGKKNVVTVSVTGQWIGEVRRKRDTVAVDTISLAPVGR
jgi:hypothetical protein